MHRKVYIILLLMALLLGAAPYAMGQQASSDTTATQEQSEQVDEAPKSFFEKLFPFLFNKNNEKKADKDSSSQQLDKRDRFDELTQDELNYYFLRSVKLNKHDLMVRLLEEGALINARDEHGRTALIEAARTGKYRICETLIDFGASVNADDRYDGTALDYASRAGYVDIVNLLLKNGAKQ
ncbi:MAG: ankyrin repeat domain-containing protein [Bacteroidota bacterium]